MMLFPLEVISVDVSVAPAAVANTIGWGAETTDTSHHLEAGQSKIRRQQAQCGEGPCPGLDIGAF